MIPSSLLDYSKASRWSPSSPVSVGHEEPSSPGSVNMQPDLLLLTDVGQGIDGVEGAKHRGARRAVDEEGEEALGPVLLEKGLCHNKIIKGK